MGEKKQAEELSPAVAGAFSILQRMREAKRSDKRPPFVSARCDELGDVRLRRLEPEVAYVCRRRLEDVGIDSAAAIGQLEESTPTAARRREALVWVLQRCLMGPERARLLYAGPEGYQQLLRTLGLPSVADLARQAYQLNWPADKPAP